MRWPQSKSAPLGRSLGCKMIKAVLVFLVIMAVIAMIGNALFPGALTQSVKNRLRLKPAAKCNSCGRHLIGTQGCSCKKRA